MSQQYPSQTVEGLPQLSGPLYHQIQASLRHRIRANEWSGGRSLPNETILARQYGVSIGTMRKALEILGQEKLIVRRQGLGTYVNDKLIAPPAAFHVWTLDGRSGEDCLFEVVGRAIDKPSPQECAALEIADGARVARVRGVSRHAGQYESIDEYVIPQSEFPDIADFISSDAQSFAPWLALFERRLARYEDEIIAVTAEHDIALRMDIDIGRALLKIARRGFDSDEKPLMLCRRHVRLDAAGYIATPR